MSIQPSDERGGPASSPSDEGERHGVCLIVNGAEATNADLAERATAPHILRGERVETRVTSTQGHAREIARDAVTEGFRRIIVMGGDGTINEVLNGIAPDFEGVELAIVPAGTANDFARSIGMPADDHVDALEQALCRESYPVDVVRATTDDGRVTYFINVAAGGYGGEVSEAAARAGKGELGAAAYWLAGASKLVDLPSYQATLVIDHHRLEAPIYGLAIANARYVAGGIPIAPDAMLDDGFVEVVLVAEQSFADVLGAGADILLRRQHESDRVTMLRGRSVRVEAIPDLVFNEDGELRGRIKGVFEVLPRALRVVFGADAERCVEPLLPASEETAGADSTPPDQAGASTSSSSSSCLDEPIAESPGQATEVVAPRGRGSNGADRRRRAGHLDPGDEGASDGPGASAKAAIATGEQRVQEIRLRAAPEEVFAVLADPRGWAAWHPNIDRVEATEGASIVGAKGPAYHQAFLLHEKSGEELMVTRVVSEPPRRIGWRFVDEQGSFQREWVFELQSTAADEKGGVPASSQRTLLTALQRTEERSALVRLLVDMLGAGDSELRLFLGSLAGHFGEPLNFSHESAARPVEELP